MNIQGNGIYQSDCLVLLERIESEQLSMAYIDPPAFTQITRSPISKAEDEGEEAKELTEHLLLITKVIQQVHRILNAHGNLFFHSEPYLAGDYRQILNQVFGRGHYRLEYILYNFRTFTSGYIGPRIEHDTIFHYSKGDQPIYHPQYKLLASDKTYSQADEHGKYRLEPLTTRISGYSLRFEWNGFTPPSGASWIYSKEQLDEFHKAGKISYRSHGQPPRLKVYLNEPRIEVGSIWDDISSVARLSKESLNFPGQKPLILLNRLINMGSNQGDLVLDPFCGSGTSLISAQLNGRRWLGCDISSQVCSLAIKRVEVEFKFQANIDFSFGYQELLEQNFPIIFGTYNETVRNFNKQIKSARFIVNQPISIEETRHNEFKEIEPTTNPVTRILDQVDEYTVAFLNSEGGQILWGMRDRDRTVSGIKLTYKQRDEIRRGVNAKIQIIQPAIAITAFHIDFHCIYQGTEIVPDLYVVQLVVPAVSNRSLYYTGGGKAFVRIDGANRELKGLLLQAEILKRFSIQQQ